MGSRSKSHVEGGVRVPGRGPQRYASKAERRIARRRGKFTDVLLSVLWRKRDESKEDV
jgi:hypothetical protein